MIALERFHCAMGLGGPTPLPLRRFGDPGVTVFELGVLLQQQGWAALSGRFEIAVKVPVLSVRH